MYDYKTTDRKLARETQYMCDILDPKLQGFTFTPVPVKDARMKVAYF